MSRGFGRQQREILAALDEHGPFYLAALCDGDLSSRYKALHWAAGRLASAGKIELFTCAHGRPRVVVAPPGSRSKARLDRDGQTGTLPFDRNDVETTSRTIEVARAAARASE